MSVSAYHFDPSSTSAATDQISVSEEVLTTDPETGGMKGRKPVELHAIPWEALQVLGRVYAFGAAKYEDYNFRRGYKWSLSYDALQRHLWAWWSGEDEDPESKLNHLGHALWHIFTLLLWNLTGKGTDDRPHVFDRDDSPRR